MKSICYITIPVAIAVLINSCAPVYKCGDSKPEKVPFTWSKNLKAVVSERDKLCTSLALKEKENAGLKNTITDLTGKNKDLTDQYNSLMNKNVDLEGKYNDLINESLSKTDQFNKALKAKSDELSNKEQLLSEREKALKEMQLIIARQDSITKRLNGILRNALLGFNSDELSVEIKNGKVYVSMSDQLLFKSGSSAVEAKGKEALKLLGEVLDKNLNIDILVEGHTDNVPIKTSLYKDNWDLSVARATSIVRILTNDYKIAPTRLTASGKGEYFPRSSNDTAEGRARNRRTEIILSPKLDEIMQLLKD
ncbi:MAG: flagellar motor protein MotB [Bacteroidetes bacterium RBG_13_43_22]|nr:MAG: flagellar motor protein MotB [Bacteroidetes bacterium RBG_13_43_22]